MSSRSLALRLAAAAALAALATGASAQEAGRLAVKTDGLSPFVARSVEEKAAQGVGELRRYVERTRMVHGLYLPDLVREEPVLEQAAKPAADEGPVVAQRQVAPATRTAAARSAPRTQVAKRAVPASPVVMASGKASAPAKGATSKRAGDVKLALAGQKTKRA
jgi:hypothetical protein